MDCKIKDCGAPASAVIRKGERRVTVCAQHERQGIRGGWTAELLPDAPHPRDEHTLRPQARRKKPPASVAPKPAPPAPKPRRPGRPGQWFVRKDDAECCLARRDELGRPPIGYCSPACERRP